RGTGKTTAAKVLSRAINCTNSPTGEPCGECDACRQLSGENNLDIVEIDAASNNGVDEIRDLRDKVKYPPTVGRYKVYIIDEVHMLSIGAFNALLKTLEEPPAHAVFILATTEPQRLPATILSRCQRFDFKRIPAAVIEGRLYTVLNATGSEADAEAVSLIARAAEGGMRDALSILDMCLSYGGGQLDTALVREVLGASDRTFLFDFAAALIGGDVPTAFHMIDRLMRDGRDPAVFTREVTGHMRALLVAKSCADGLEDLLEVTREDADRYRAQASDASNARLMRLMSLFIQAENDMKWASQQRSVLELCAVRGCHPEREQGEEALLDRVASLEHAIEQGVVVSHAEAKPAGSAQQPAAEQAPAPRHPVRRPPPENDAQAYDQGVKLVLKDPGVGMALKKGKFIGVEDDMLTIEFPEGGEVFIQKLSRPEAKALIEARMSEVFGRPVHVHLICQSTQKKPASPRADGKKKLDQVYEAFPREKIEIIDD
ncbi:MAG: DNA polymerase III subunit gamma/tau, partial [Clostridia bacterium]|nr:DNA polymerase III subunit gamma/tau [Clostridia bacterium]